MKIQQRGTGRRQGDRTVFGERLFVHRVLMQTLGKLFGKIGHGFSRFESEKRKIGRGGAMGVAPLAGAPRAGGAARPGVPVRVATAPHPGRFL